MLLKEQEYKDLYERLQEIHNGNIKKGRRDYNLLRGYKTKVIPWL